MPSTLDVTQKINSLTNIQKVTGAMNLIASIRFRKLMARQKALESFESALGDLLSATLPLLLDKNLPLVADHPTQTRWQAVVFTSDRGLCGSHNHSVNRALDRLVGKAQAEGKALEVVCLGTKGAKYARRRGYPVVQQTEMKGAVAAVRELADRTVDRFLAGEVDAVVLVYNRFVSTLRQLTVCQTVLPLCRFSPRATSPGREPALESGPATFADEAGVWLVRQLLTLALGHSMVSEQAARMTAMDSASKNARDLTSLAVKERNRVRQAGITSELIEIISGKEAMKGRPA